MNIIETTNETELISILNQCNEYANIIGNESTTFTSIEKHITEDKWYCNYDAIINNAGNGYAEITEFLNQKIRDEDVFYKSLMREQMIAQGYIKEYIEV